MTIPIKPRLRIGLLGLSGLLLVACADNGPPPPPEPLELSQPIAVDTPGQQVQFEFETTARNFASYRTYAVELELQRRSPATTGTPDIASINIPFEVSLQRREGTTWQEIATQDSYQARARNGVEPLPSWHHSESWRYASLASGSDGSYLLNVTALPLELNSRYRLQIQTVHAISGLQDYSARLVVHASRPAGK